MRLNWRKVVLLVLLCELLMLYWSTLQHTETVRELQSSDRNEHSANTVTVAPQPGPADMPDKERTNG